MKIIDSVAAVFCHDGNVFSIRRQSYLNAFPGYDTFPGGKIDREDSSNQHQSSFLSELDGQKAHALVREIQEELAYDIPEGITSGQVTSVRYLATALAPALTPVRFRLHFFRIDLKTRPLFVEDRGEIANSYWQTPQQLLDRFHGGDSLMVPPLRWMLEELGRNPQGANIGDFSPQFEEENYVPQLEFLSGLNILPIPSSTFPPERRTNAFLLGDGDRQKILVDPSPESPQVMEKLLRTLQPYDVDVLFITHHHRDHREHVPELARRLNVPVWMSEYTYSRIVQREGSSHFSGVDVELKREGDSVTSWKGEAVRVYEVPGHDAGQLALAPESLRWFIVGDLIQSIGSVVIPAPEGDMATYFQTLEKIIDLDPAVILPSHGTPMRSSLRLAAALKHRRVRENEIMELHIGGKSTDQILEIIYGCVEQHLRPFAMLNIESHIVKLRQEGRL
ncbi:MAG: MBL fold metallo-hydrolase [Desulfuromonadales bacterium]|nr:MBL fold metallo-hydrolase [Desulfuromonadales bacterium]